MSLSDKAHRLGIGLREIDAQMEGLNPKTTSFQKLAERRVKVVYELEQLGAKRTDQTKV